VKIHCVKRERTVRIPRGGASREARRAAVRRLRGDGPSVRGRPPRCGADSATLIAGGPQPPTPLAATGLSVAWGSGERAAKVLQCGRPSALTPTALTAHAARKGWRRSARPVELRRHSRHRSARIPRSRRRAPLGAAPIARRDSSSTGRHRARQIVAGKAVLSPQVHHRPVNKTHNSLL